MDRPLLDLRETALELQWNGYIVKCTVYGSNLSNRLPFGGSM